MYQKIRVVAIGKSNEAKFNPRLLIGKSIKIKGATGHNLQGINVEFPLGKLICVTGVSGSGKSTLINETLFKALFKTIIL